MSENFYTYKVKKAAKAAPAAPAANVHNEAHQTDYYVKDTIKKPLTFPKPVANPHAYDKPIGPNRQTRMDKVDNAISKIRGGINNVTSNPQVKGVVDYVKQRSVNVANEMNAPTKKAGYRKDKYDADNGLPSNDMFGVSFFGSNNRDEDYDEAPRRKKRRKQRPKPRYEDRGESMGGVRYPRNPF